MKSRRVKNLFITGLFCQLGKVALGYKGKGDFFYFYFGTFMTRWKLQRTPFEVKKCSVSRFYDTQNDRLELIVSTQQSVLKDMLKTFVHCFYSKFLFTTFAPKVCSQLFFFKLLFTTFVHYFCSQLLFTT